MNEITINSLWRNSNGVAFEVVAKYGDRYELIKLGTNDSAYVPAEIIHEFLTPVK